MEAIPSSAQESKLTVAFYQLQVTPVEKVLPRILEKLYAEGFITVVRAGTEDRVAALSHFLWTYAQSSFLPHGWSKESHPNDQPIWLTTGEDRPDKARALVLLDSVCHIPSTPYQRCYFFFDGTDLEASLKAQAYRKTLQERGLEMRFWVQTQTGGWVQGS